MTVTKKLSLIFALLLAFSLLFTLSAICTESEVTYPTEGYVYNKEGKETNIKWSITEVDGKNVCTFTIDSSATDKVSANTVTACTAEGKSVGWSNNKDVPWFYGGNVNKMVFGEGIVGASGGVYMVISTIKEIEVSKDFVTTGFATFEANAGLNTFYVTGTEPEAGTIDLTYMKTLGQYCFDGAKFQKIIFGENVKDISVECFKANKFAEIDFPATITSVSSKAFTNTASLKRVSFANPDTKILADAFDNCVQLFTIGGYKGSTAEAFAMAGGYEFVDIETGEVLIEGTRKVEKDPNEILAQYPIENEDAGGLLEALYNGSRIVNTHWSYFKDSKTLVFRSMGSGYNETGNQTTVSDNGKKYSEYKFEVEHIIVGPGIHKISGSAFEGFSALKTVQYSANLQKIDPKAFNNCTSLASVYKLGLDAEEGVADIAIISEYPSSILKNTAIETVILNPKTTADMVNPIAFIGAKNIVATFSDDMKEYAEANMFNLINCEDETQIHEFYRYINPDTLASGSASIASFDEETGTLTILGAGELYDIVNYYGGGSKQVPWLKYRNQIKKIVIGPRITYIGKYLFCQTVNLQELELSGNPITIGAGAFEKCYNLRSVYVSGNEPIVGTFDLSSLQTLESWTFAYNYMAVNVILGEHITEAGGRLFEDSMNLSAVYGVPGSYAETWAEENGKLFKDISAETPTAKLATPPEMNQDEKDRAEMGMDGEDTDKAETELSKYCIIIDNADGTQTVETVLVTDVVTTERTETTFTPVIFIAIGVFVVAAGAAAVIVAKNKGKEKK